MANSLTYVTASDDAISRQQSVMSELQKLKKELDNERVKNKSLSIRLRIMEHKFMHDKSETKIGPEDHDKTSVVFPGIDLMRRISESTKGKNATWPEQNVLTHKSFDDEIERKENVLQEMKQAYADNEFDACLNCGMVFANKNSKCRNAMIARHINYYARHGRCSSVGRVFAPHRLKKQWRKRAQSGRLRVGDRLYYKNCMCKILKDWSVLSLGPAPNNSKADGETFKDPITWILNVDHYDERDARIQNLWGLIYHQDSRLNDNNDFACVSLRTVKLLKEVVYAMAK